VRISQLHCCAIWQLVLRLSYRCRFLNLHLCFLVSSKYSKTKKTYRYSRLFSLSTDTEFLLALYHFHNFSVFSVFSAKSWCSISILIIMLQLHTWGFARKFANMGLELIQLFSSLFASSWSRRWRNTIFISMTILSCLAVFTILIINVFEILTWVTIFVVVHYKIQALRLCQIIGSWVEYFRISWSCCVYHFV